MRYLEAEAYIKSRGVHIAYVHHPDAWRAGRSSVYKGVSEIVIWADAYRIYGWDIMTSVLIHEFGHCELHRVEGLDGGDIEAERKANEYGQKSVPAHLVPPSYLKHREFFLQSYETPGSWTEEICVRRFEEWQIQNG
jgi:hypothetical protein